jgi:carboxyl-terminal processing protease
MLTGLDPHSSYMDAKSFRDMQVQTRGEFGGLGIEVTMEDGLIKVVSPIDDTPASRAGIMANDIITNLDDEAVQGLTLNQAVEKMRGPVNTKIKLKIIRKGQDNPIDVTWCATTSASARCAPASRPTTSPISASPPSTSRPPKA